MVLALALVGVTHAQSPETSDTRAAIKDDARTVGHAVAHSAQSVGQTVKDSAEKVKTTVTRKSDEPQPKD